MIFPDAPGQPHLQGTQSRHTMANLTKEPALFPRFLNTPQVIAYSMLIDLPL
ncbi:MAG: hypothetical protein H7Y86_10195 [Rhizobacter sp.]|nr:hypothetical protein [Ferruginibacter sp.]